jgi:hypothetical protein
LAPSPTWQIFTNGLIGGWVSSVAVDPEDVDIAYCTYSNYGVSHVLRTVDGGQSWVSIDGIEATGVPDIPAHWIEVRPCNPQQLYVATELGVFVSDDGGATWEPANDGLAHTVIESLDFKNDNTLVAFSHGRGAFITSLEACPGAGCAHSCGDIDGSGGVVDLNDFATFAICFGTSAPAGDCNEQAFVCSDLDASGLVDLNDFATFALLYGQVSMGSPPDCLRE